MIGQGQHWTALTFWTSVVGINVTTILNVVEGCNWGIRYFLYLPVHSSLPIVHSDTRQAELYTALGFLVRDGVELKNQIWGCESYCRRG